jgi:hypothetical protein
LSSGAQHVRREDGTVVKMGVPRLWAVGRKTMEGKGERTKRGMGGQGGEREDKGDAMG